MKPSRFVLPTIRLSQKTRYVLATLILAIASGNEVANATNGMTQVEVFDTTDLKIVGQPANSPKEPYRYIDLQFYQLNGIRLVEAELSRELAADHDQSKRLIMQRIQVLGDQTRARMQRSAIGLVRAMQYGIDRFPAIVFDGQLVVYGVSDLQVAIAYYQAWQAGDKP